MQEKVGKITLKEIQRVMEAAELLYEVLTPEERQALRKHIDDQHDNDSEDQYVSLSILDEKTSNNR